MFLKLLLLLLSCSTIVYSIDSWTDLIGSSEYEYGHGVTMDNDNNIYTCGDTLGNITGAEVNSGGYDVVIAKYNVDGVQQWIHVFGTSGNDRCYGICTDDTHVYMTGTVGGAIHGQSYAGGDDIIIMKYNFDGNRIWTRLLGTLSSDYSRAIIVTCNTLYITGNAYGDLDGETSAGLNDAFIASYTTDGDKNWVKLYGGASDDYSDAIVYSNGVVCITGSTGSSLGSFTNMGAADVFAACFNSTTRDLLWVTQFGSAANNDYGRGIAIDSSSVYITGQVLGTIALYNATGNNDCVVASFDLITGSNNWFKLLKSVGVDRGEDITIDAAYQLLYVVGEAGGAFPGQSNNQGAFIASYTANDGTLQSARSIISESGTQRATSIVLQNNITCIVGYGQGTMNGETNSGFNDMFIYRETACSAGASYDGFVCNNCTCGKYATIGQEYCSDCSLGSYSPIGSSQCMNCPAGKYSNESDACSSYTCISCTPGRYSNTVGSSTCTQCPRGSYSSINDATSCTSCDLNIHSTGNENTYCALKHCNCVHEGVVWSLIAILSLITIGFFIKSKASRAVWIITLFSVGDFLSDISYILVQPFRSAVLQYLCLAILFIQFPFFIYVLPPNIHHIYKPVRGWFKYKQIADARGYFVLDVLSFIYTCVRVFGAIVYCIFAIPLLSSVGYILFLLKVLSVPYVAKLYTYLWDDTFMNNHQQDQSNGIIPKLYHTSMACELVLESLPQIVLQSFNNQGQWTTVAIISIIFSMFGVVNHFYKYTYWLCCGGKSLSDIPMGFKDAKHVDNIAKMREINDIVSMSLHDIEGGVYVNSSSGDVELNPVTPLPTHVSIEYPQRHEDNNEYSYDHAVKNCEDLRAFFISILPPNHEKIEVMNELITFTKALQKHNNN